ncbi:AraC family transcriptional regulator [Methylococcus sp. ANG]|uniref:AraC family transcriptional regulator n=1 Tax=Methylococcus sp. ANG TaxID=3231903 RepID=UPI00345AC329
MNATNLDRYRARFRKVLEYVDANLDGDLTLDRLCGVAAFSKYHFHRRFADLFGIGVYQYVQLRRLKRAAYQLAFRSYRPIIDIAMGSGYERPESFARAFKKSFGQSPSEFRRQPQWEPWHATYQPLNQLRSLHMPSVKHPEQIRIIDFDDTRVAVFEHRGDPSLIGDSIRSFIAWRRQNGLPPRISATFNILYDDPAVVAPRDFRMDLCAATEREVAENEFGVVAKTIPGGRCAVLRYVGSDDTLAETVRYLYSEWLPQSGEALRDFPVYLQRIELFPDVAESEAVTDVFLPLR